MRYFTLLFVVAAGAASLSAGTLPTLSSASILNRVKVLASDDFEGRAPASPGEEKTVRYLVDEFKKSGLAPGNPNGTYLQNVPMIGITSQPTATFSAGGQTFKPTHLIDYVALSKRVTPRVDVNMSEIVFVGYGIVAPEFGWDDYKGIDVRGKTVVMLINDPPVTDPATGQLDPTVFEGRINVEPPILAQVVEHLEGISLDRTELDTKGVAFEEFMGGFFKGDFGQYFTPRELIGFAVEVLNPERKQLVLDPACGSGGFLLYALDHVRREADRRFPKHRSDAKQSRDH